MAIKWVRVHAYWSRSGPLPDTPENNAWARRAMIRGWVLLAVVVAVLVAGDFL